jgi:hypothetical protein
VLLVDDVIYNSNSNGNVNNNGSSKVESTNLYGGRGYRNKNGVSCGIGINS